MMKTRGYELRLPADWPPEAVTVNGAAVKKADALGKGGWRFEGNTLTTIVPVASISTAAKVTIEVRRAPGLVAKRGELDAFAGTLTRLRGAYDSMWATTAGTPPDELTAAMQTGDRISYFPETAAKELANFHAAVEKAQSAVQEFNGRFQKVVNDSKVHVSETTNEEMAAKRQKRIDAMARAMQLMADAAK
jgi:alpha-glucosidase